MVLLNLFSSFLRVGFFAIGGAYSFLPLLEKEIVQKYHWLTKEEFLDVLAMVKAFPGAISIKYATYTGYKIAGIPGIILANLGNLFAPIFFVIFASLFYTKYKDLKFVKNIFSTIQIVMFAFIISVAFQLIQVDQLIQPKNLFIIIISFALFNYTNIHPAIILIVAGLLGIF